MAKNDNAAAVETVEPRTRRANRTYEEKLAELQAAEAKRIERSRGAREKQLAVSREYVAKYGPRVAEHTARIEEIERDYPDLAAAQVTD